MILTVPTQSLTRRGIAEPILDIKTSKIISNPFLTALEPLNHPSLCFTHDISITDSIQVKNSKLTYQIFSMTSILDYVSLQNKQNINCLMACLFWPSFPKEFSNWVHLPATCSRKEKDSFKHNLSLAESLSFQSTGS
jgi:hypothetical protein